MNLWKHFEAPYCLLANNCNCEFVHDAFIRQPACFWTSFAYIMGAFFLISHVKERGPELKLWTGLCVLLGLSSMFAHGSFIRPAMAMDFASIITLICFFPLINLMRPSSWGKLLLILAGFFVSIFFVMYSLDKVLKIVICVAIFGVALADLAREGGLRERSLWRAVGVLALSFSAFVLDEMKVGCDPMSLFQLHGLWHIGTAFSIYLYGRWRFIERPASAPAGYTSGIGA